MRISELINEYSFKKAQVEYFVIACALLLLLLCGSITLFYDIPFNTLSRDPIAVIDTNLLPHIGMLSNMGAILWSVSFGISTFSFFLFYKKNDTNSRFLLIYSSLFTLILLIDDLFMVHDKIFPHFFQKGEIYLFVFYLFAISYYLVRFRFHHLKSKYLFLIVALLCFGLSLFVDYRFTGSLHPARHFVEDGFKFMGIAFWTSYLINISKTYALGPKEI